MSLPAYPSSAVRASPLVQMCHGAPGLLLLLGAARHHEKLNKYRVPDLEEAVQLCSERLWEQGLLSKGGGLCHGIGGNAWPWLTLAAAELENYPHLGEDRSAPADIFLARALAFLLHARETPPFKPGAESNYRMPDHPYSLYEGLAGTICAWSEACMLITLRIKLLESPENKGDDEWVAKHLVSTQGFPGLGGHGAFGLL